MVSTKLTGNANQNMRRLEAKLAGASFMSIPEGNAGVEAQEDTFTQTLLLLLLRSLLSAACCCSSASEDDAGNEMLTGWCLIHCREVTQCEIMGL